MDTMAHLHVRSDRLIEAIALVISETEKRGQRPTQYDVVKTLFLADRAHLNDYGRPVTFDNYVAMKHGPVPSRAYDMLKDPSGTYPWRRQEVPGSRHFAFYDAKNEPDLDVLSPSDIEALKSALDLVLRLGFARIQKLTHDDAAYEAAWGEGRSRSAPMDLALLFETPDADAAEHVAFLSRHQ
jgi:uncharacterized phage-associated protein